jgi:hypothetical protein
LKDYSQKKGQENSQNIGNEIQILSKRAKEFVHSPQHLKEKLDSPSQSTHPHWEIGLELGSHDGLLNDKIVTIFYDHPKALVSEKLFLETFSRFLVGRSIKFLENITFRELENYLRDENHLPVFENSHSVELETQYKAVKNSLLSYLILKKFKENNLGAGALKPWQELTLVEKNSAVKMCFSFLNLHFPRVKPLELVLATNEEISVLINDFPLSLELILEVLHGHFEIPPENSSFKVVAVQ